MSINTFNCCILNTSTPQKQISPNKWDDNKISSEKKIRAGCIILKNNKVLLIQSYGKFWGLPKGHLEENETITECAIRETFEETGIKLNSNEFKKEIKLYNGEVTYFFVDGDNIDYNINNILDKQEITGINWICIQCLESYSTLETVHFNSHLKKLIPHIKKYIL